MKMNLYQLLQILNLSVNEFVQKVDKKAYKLWAKYLLFYIGSLSKILWLCTTNYFKEVCSLGGKTLLLIANFCPITLGWHFDIFWLSDDLEN